MTAALQAARASSRDLRALAERMDEMASCAAVLNSDNATTLSVKQARQLARVARNYAEAVDQAGETVATLQVNLLLAEDQVSRLSLLLARIEGLSLWGLICFWWEGKR